MSVTAQFGYPDVPKSITNANVQTKDALDVSNPMSFILFIKTISNSFEPLIELPPAPEPDLAIK